MLVSISMQTFYSIQHIQAAAYMARRSGVVENALTDAVAPESVMLKAYVCSALFSSVAFLEALANEIIAEAGEPGGGMLSSINEEHRQAIASLAGDPAQEKIPVLEKFRQILRAAGREPFSKGVNPCQKVSTLISLRNELVHYKAALFDVSSNGKERPGNFRQSSLSDRIKHKFTRRKHSGGLCGDYWVGYGCAQWAVGTVVEFADEVFKKLEVTPFFDHVRNELNTACTTELKTAPN